MTHDRLFWKVAARKRSACDRLGNAITTRQAERMGEAIAGVVDHETSAVRISVPAVTPARAGKRFALASVEIDVDGIQVQVHGIRALHVPPASTRIELPMFRDAAGMSRSAITLPEEVRGPIGDAVLEALVEHGLAKRRVVVAATT